MTELDRIKKNINGEIPAEKYTIVRVKSIDNPAKILALYKSTVIAFIENAAVDPDDKKWNDLLPKELVKFSEQLTEEDYHHDEVISGVSAMAWDMINVKEWEWYSSKVITTGFEVYLTGNYSAVFEPLLHHLGIPFVSMFIEHDGVEYPTQGRTDVLTYRKWDPETMILSPGTAE